MYRGLRTEIQRITFVTAFCALIGWLTNHVAWSLIAGGALYSAFLLRQMQRFYIWLSRHSHEAPPSSSGIWGDIFDAIYRMRKQQAQQRDDIQQQLKRMEDSTAALKDGVVLLDRSGQIEFWNEAAGRLLGLRRNSDEGQLLTNLVRDPLFVTHFLQDDFSEPLTLLSPIRSDMHLEIQLNVFGDNEKLMVVRDITRLQKLEKMRSDFVANVSHELRTPLTVLKGYLETLQDQGEAVPAHWQKAIGHMQQQTQRMQLLVDDLLLLSRLESSQPRQPHTPVSLDRIATRLQDDARHLSPEHSVVLVGEPLQLLGNENDLLSALGNLVSNALRYSPATAPVTLSWGKDAQGIFFSVADKGPGIDPIHIPRLTERFYRVDAGRSRNEGGTGLGLAIVKHAVAGHGGQLEIRSTPGSGSTFTCRFPSRLALP